MYPCILLSVALAMVSFESCAQEKESSAVPYRPITKFDPSRDAAQDMRDAVAEAERSGRRVLLDVGGEWCVWCHKLDAFFRENEDLEVYLHKNYVVVKVNDSPENKNEKVLSQFPHIKGYPHLFVLDENGKLLHSQDTGELESGDHHDFEKILAFLRTWAPKTRTD